MVQYLSSRLAQAVIVIAGVLAICFVVLHLTGDPARLMLPLEADEEQVAAMRHALGFDQPLLVQAWRFFGGAVRGDFGDSLRFRGQPAIQLVWERFPATLELAAAAMAISLSVSLALGVTAALHRYSLWGGLAMLLALIGQSVPVFWLGLVLILIFAVGLQWLPSSGRGGWANLVLPGMTLGMYYMARTTRLVRSCMLEVLDQDYIRTAHAKGLSQTTMLYRHALKNAAIPLVTIVGLDLGSLLGGAVITETVFAWPGVGRLVVESIYARDFPVVLAAVFFMAVFFVVINLGVDLLYVWLDPRIRLAKKQSG